MTPEEYSHLTKGDQITTDIGPGNVQYFGRWTGKGWVKSTRKAGKGAFIYFGDDAFGWVHREDIYDKLACPGF